MSTRSLSFLITGKLYDFRKWDSSWLCQLIRIFVSTLLRTWVWTLVSWWQSGDSKRKFLLLHRQNVTFVALSLRWRENKAGSNVPVNFSAPSRFIDQIFQLGRRIASSDTKPEPLYSISSHGRFAECENAIVRLVYPFVGVSFVRMVWNNAVSTCRPFCGIHWWCAELDF